MPKSRISGERPLKKNNISSIPNNKPILYEILNSRGNNVYTGTAKRGRGQERLEEHLQGGKDPIKGGNSFRYKQMSSIRDAQREEQRIIEKEKPKFNK